MGSSTKKASGCQAVTHADLIRQAAKWLQKTGRSVVLTDMTHAGPETADVIGWKGQVSTVVECKVSRADYLADKKKSFRANPESGMGALRYFCAPTSLIKPEELPKDWGLLEVDGSRLKEVRKARKQAFAAKEEVSLLLSALRRVSQNAPVGVSVRCYVYDSKGRATLGVLGEKDETV